MGLAAAEGNTRVIMPENWQHSGNQVTKLGLRQSESG